MKKKFIYVFFILFVLSWMGFSFTKNYLFLLNINEQLISEEFDKLIVYENFEREHISKTFNDKTLLEDLRKTFIKQKYRTATRKYGEYEIIHWSLITNQNEEYKMYFFTDPNRKIIKIEYNSRRVETELDIPTSEKLIEILSHE